VATPAAASAAAAAASPATDPVDLIDVPAGQPATERYPGAVDAAAYGPGSSTTPGTPAGPPYGSWGAEPFTATLPEQAPGGGYQDTGWQTGHDGPQAGWDSSAGQPFSPSGAVAPVLHGEDTGAVYQQEHVIPAAIGSLTRRTMTGQTWNRVSGTQDTHGRSEPNGRLDLDQQQWHNPDGYDPWMIPYAERPVLNNLAYEAVSSAAEGGYAASGGLPDRSLYNEYAAVAYEAPADPAVDTVAAAGDPGIGGGWL